MKQMLKQLCVFSSINQLLNIFLKERYVDFFSSITYNFKYPPLLFPQVFETL